MSEQLRVPAEVFPPGVHLVEELEARGWTVADLVARMSGNPAVNELAVDLCIHVNDDPDLHLGGDLAQLLAGALGTSPALWLNLDESWRASLRGRS